MCGVITSLTQVRECLMFSAQLRLPDSLSTVEKSKQVDIILEELVRHPSLYHVSMNPAPEPSARILSSIIQDMNAAFILNARPSSAQRDEC